MDYSIGSIADLVTGKDTPNKPKVVAKRIEKPTTFEPIVPEPLQSDSIDNQVEKRIKKRKSNTNQNDGNVEVKSKRPRLRKRAKTERDPEELQRTIFVGNLSTTTTKLQLTKFFKKYGTVESARLRNVTPSDPKIPKKVALITKQLHPDRKSLNGFVRFATAEEAQKAAAANGQLLNNHHIRVEVCSNEKQYDQSKAIFVGNLPFTAEEEDLWKLFELCGQISSIRLIRDSKTGIGKGFAYVNFSNSDSVQLALELEDVKLNDRELRITLCNTKAAKKSKQLNKVTKIVKPGKPRRPRQQKTTDIKDKESNEIKVHGNNEEFQGATIAKKKKKQKVSKATLQKKKLIKQLTGHSEKKNV